jgi:DNA-binding CsgD family transcriptional regulator/DNA-binding phage protein
MERKHIPQDATACNATASEMNGSEYGNISSNAMSTREKIERVLTEQQEQRPGEGIVLAQVTKHAGVSRQRVSQIYYELSDEGNVLPPIRARAAAEIGEVALFQKVITLSNDHSDLAEVARLANTSQWRVRTLLQTYLEGEPRDPKLVARENQIKSLRERGMKSVDIEAALGLTKGEMIRALRRMRDAQVIPRDRVREPDYIVMQRREHIRAYIEEGASTQEISEQMKISVKVVENDIHSLYKTTDVPRRRKVKNQE